jgi:polysaccharide pyruvyl transferase WcaK-like protein
MKVIHIASHKGNIGDMVNHSGFYKSILAFDANLEIERTEIRNFYFSARNRMNFDVDYAKHLNKFDLVVFGGGGFFDAQWNRSCTGTTLNFSEEFIDSINTRALVNAMGYHEYPGKTTEEICDKFRSFLSNINSRKNWIITVRNDKSFERLYYRYGEYLTNQILKVPDNGFFCDFGNKSKPESTDMTIGMCITNDLFSDDFNKGVQPDIFNQYMADIINGLCRIGYRIVLLPHTPADIGTISELYKNIYDDYKRSRIIVGSLDPNSDNAVESLGNSYKACDCIIGMRFHSLITGLDCRVPTIALAGHEQIRALFEELGLSDYIIQVDNLHFADKLFALIDRCIKERNNITRQYDEIFEKLKLQKSSYINSILTFLNQ